MLIPIIICGVVLLTLIIMYFVYNNKEVALRKEADAQRKAMFANSGENRDFGEALYGKNEIADFFDKAKRLGVETLGQLRDLLNQEESKGNTEKEKIAIYKMLLDG